ncbi:MAG: dTMP kinase [Candidatus Parcubacteria bacterium]|nr:dTMP kinase [Candidatus Parcubacteria bacterium]
MDRQPGSKYIVLEGPDYSGKDTQAKLLMEYLKQSGREAIFIREPGTGRVGDGIRHVLTQRDLADDPLSTEAEMLLFMANRAQLRQNFILPNLAEGRIVVSSRDRLSTRAYQGYGRGQSLDLIKAVGEFAMKGLYPELYLIFMVPVDVILERRAAAKDVDRIEQEGPDFWEKVLQGYKDFIRDNPQMVAVFDATQSIQEIHGQVPSRVEQLLG